MHHFEFMSRAVDVGDVLGDRGVAVISFARLRFKFGWPTAVCSYQRWLGWTRS